MYLNSVTVLGMILNKFTLSYLWLTSKLPQASDLKQYLSLILLMNLDVAQDQMGSSLWVTHTVVVRCAYSPPEGFFCQFSCAWLRNIWTLKQLELFSSSLSLALPLSRARARARTPSFSFSPSFVYIVTSSSLFIQWPHSH